MVWHDDRVKLFCKRSYGPSRSRDTKIGSKYKMLSAHKGNLFNKKGKLMYNVHDYMNVWVASYLQVIKRGVPCIKMLKGTLGVLRTSTLNIYNWSLILNVMLGFSSSHAAYDSYKHIFCDIPWIKSHVTHLSADMHFIELLTLCTESLKWEPCSWSMQIHYRRRSDSVNHITKAEYNEDIYGLVWEKIKIKVLIKWIEESVLIQRMIPPLSIKVTRKRV